MNFNVKWWWEAAVMAETKVQIPLFTEYSLEYLHDHLGVGYSYLESMEKGTIQIRPGFRFKASAILRRTEPVLFGDSPGG